MDAAGIGLRNTYAILTGHNSAWPFSQRAPRGNVIFSNCSFVTAIHARFVSNETCQTEAE